MTTAPAEILIADDHALFRKGFGLLLRDALPGVGIKEVAGFDAALDLLASSPQMTGAFFDLMMPGMAGPDSIRAVREAYPALHFAAVTGLEDRALALQVIDAGANGYIVKEDGPGEVIRAIEPLLDRGSVVSARVAARPSVLSRATTQWM